MSKYVDLSVDTTGNSGTEGEPFGYTDWYNSVDGTDTETYYIKGSLDSTDVPLDFLSYSAGSVDHKFLPWNFDSSGPWRVATADSAPRLKGLFQNCILSFENPLGTNVRIGDSTTACKLISSFLKFSSYLINGNSAENSIKGSTITGNQFWSDPPTTLEIVDSQLDITTWGAPP